MITLVVAPGGAIGACLRFLTDRQLKAWQPTLFPWGTFVVNIAGSFVLGILAGVALFGTHIPIIEAFVGTGLCGALTTYSTFSYETAHMFTDGERLFSIANVLTTVLAGLGAGVIGILVAASFWLP